MSYIVEQKIKGKTYLYQVESYWDSEKKQPRQKRKYLGRKKDDFKQQIINNLTSISVKIYGDIFLLKELTTRLDLSKILELVFPDLYNEILALAYYEISQGTPYYLFPFWADERELPDVKKIDSTAISGLCHEIGKSKPKQLDFVTKWIEHLKPIKAVYYDITSVSSYSTNIDFVEWGHNRDDENLPQINLGLVCCAEKALPIYYRIFCGSMVDVSTLKNTISFLNAFGLTKFLCVVDRGFYSSSNIIELNKAENRIDFVQPLPFTVKKVKQLVTNNKRKLGLSYNAFWYENEILYYVKDKYELDDENKFESHIFYNERSHIDQKHVMMQKIIEIHAKNTNKSFSSKKKFDDFVETEISSKFREFFRFDRFTKKMELNNKAIEKAITRLGTFVIATNRTGMSKDEILSIYRKKDSIEKMFDMSKNEMDGGRLRAHEQTTMEGRLFIKFIALILYCEISKGLKKKDLFKKITMKEMFAELRKIRKTTMKEQQPLLSELTKRQKLIFDAFNLEYFT